MQRVPISSYEVDSFVKSDQTVTHLHAFSYSYTLTMVTVFLFINNMLSVFTT